MIKKHTKNDVKNIKSDKTNWKRIEKLTDNEIEQAALSDKDAPLISDYDASKFKSRRIMRHKLGL